MATYLSEPGRFLHDADTGKSFAIVAHRDQNALIRVRVALEPGSFAEVVQALENLDHRLRPEASRIDYLGDQIGKSPNSPLLQMMQGTIASEVDRIKKQKLKTKDTQADEEAVMNMWKTSYTTASASLKGAS